MFIYIYIYKIYIVIYINIYIYIYIYNILFLSLLNAVKCRSVYYKLKGVLKNNFSYVLFVYKSQDKRMKLEEDKCLNIFSKMNLNYHKMENVQVWNSKMFRRKSSTVNIYYSIANWNFVVVDNLQVYYIKIVVI